MLPLNYFNSTFIITLLPGFSQARSHLLRPHLNMLGRKDEFQRPEKEEGPINLSNLLLIFNTTIPMRSSERRAGVGIF